MPRLFSGEVIDALAAIAQPPVKVAEARDAHYRTLLRRSIHCDPDDRHLLKLALKHRMSARDIAPLVQLNHGNVVRRLRDLKRRLADPVVVSLVDSGCPLADEEREAALDYFLRGRSIRHIAHRRGIPLREMRRRLQYVRGWLSGRREGVRAVRTVQVQC